MVLAVVLAVDVPMVQRVTPAGADGLDKIGFDGEPTVEIYADGHFGQGGRRLRLDAVVVEAVLSVGLG